MEGLSVSLSKPDKWVCTQKVEKLDERTGLFVVYLIC